jgi:hypothetical protein
MTNGNFANAFDSKITKFEYNKYKQYKFQNYGQTGKELR